MRREAIGGYFDPPLASSTFHDLVNKGTIIPMKGMRGYYLLNESLRRLGLREVRELPSKPDSRSLEDLTRLAFTLIDHNLFPAPSWLLRVEAIDLRDVDHARRIADQYRLSVESIENIHLKLAYFGGVLDGLAMIEADADASGGC